MGFWILVPGVLMGGAETVTVVADPTGPIWVHSEAPALIIPGSRQPAVVIPGM